MRQSKYLLYKIASSINERVFDKCMSDTRFFYVWETIHKISLKLKSKLYFKWLETLNQ